MSAEPYDVAIIGGGIVGCALLFDLTQHGYRCILCESEPSIMSGASAGNSGMLHTGFDAPLYSRELECIQLCQIKIFDILRNFKIPFEKSGAHVVAWTSEEKEKLHSLLQHALAAHITDSCIATASDLYKAEPNLREGALNALYVPGEAVVDSNLLGVCFSHYARTQGAKILTSCKVTAFRDKTLDTTHAPIGAKVTVNCAGLYGDQVDALAGVQSFEIKPRKGQYCVFSKQARPLLHSMIFPVPTNRTKGVVLFRSVYGNILMGPTAEDIKDRARPQPEPGMHQYLSKKAKEVLPRLSSVPVVGSYVGVRPATQWKDYQIKAYPQLGWVTVGGIRSTGVSGSLGIAAYVRKLLQAEMDAQPTRGGTEQLEELNWSVGHDSSFVVINDCSYQMSHPIFLYGHHREASRL